MILLLLHLLLIQLLVWVFNVILSWMLQRQLNILRNILCQLFLAMLLFNFKLSEFSISLISFLLDIVLNINIKVIWHILHIMYLALIHHLNFICHSLFKILAKLLEVLNFTQCVVNVYFRFRSVLKPLFLFFKISVLNWSMILILNFIGFHRLLVLHRQVLVLVLNGVLSFVIFIVYLLILVLIYFLIYFLLVF